MQGMCRADCGLAPAYRGIDPSLRSGPLTYRRVPTRLAAPWAARCSARNCGPVSSAHLSLRHSPHVPSRAQRHARHPDSRRQMRSYAPPASVYHAPCIRSDKAHRQSLAETHAMDSSAPCYELRKPQSASGESIQIGGLDLTAVTSQIGKPHIIVQDEQNVWSLGTVLHNIIQSIGSRHDGRWSPSELPGVSD